MPHIAQERYSSLVDEKLRATLVTKDNLIFNPRYEGNPKAGKVKVPVRDTEVEVKKYDKQKGAAISAGSTTYFDINIDTDEAVNEMIDGFDAQSVPDGITAERLDSAGYSLGLSMDTKCIRALEETAGITIATTKTATEFICGHPNWCHRVQEWSVPVAIKNLTNEYIGSSAVQGRKVYGIGISKPQTVYVKRTEV